MTIAQYIAKLDTLYKTGNAREHSYRGDLQNLLMDILPDILVTNEPARVECGAPDYVLTRKDIPVGYIEAKDIGVDLHSKSLKEQFDRYKAGLSNLIFTDYMDFHFYKDGEFVAKIAIARVEGNAIVPMSENFEQFTALIVNFATTISQTIKSPTKLAQMMAGKAKLMADVIEKSLNADDENEHISELKSQMLSFKLMLIHDIDNKAFADIYSQTIAYGMFAARYHDPSLPTFSRQEAATLIPKSNPFLRKLFQDIAGYDLDTRLLWIVEELVTIFLASDVATIMQNFGKKTKQEDPVVHFYETFLGEYNPALRKARGVWYTPQPVVNFIVRGVDEVLKDEFGLSLADTSKIKINRDIQGKKRATEVHRVQILDPATGTGTFLAEVVRHIHKKFANQQGIWSQYVTKDLIPRLNGFELLMASYAMAHLKLDMLLSETGYKPTDEQRFRIFLTNSLEEAHEDTGTLFGSWLSNEATEANAIKKDTPVMVVMGNPPYSVSSTNKSKWIENLTADYKKDLNERNIQPLSDDYIKFIRFGQHFIDKNGSGVLAYISNNSFIDGIIHRQMRKHLLESFDKIYILDLHGNSKKKEVCPDGSADQNVFDIMQGVSINIFVKTGKKKKNALGEVLHYDLQGKRDFKYEFLSDNDLKSIKWNRLDYKEPSYFFVKKDFSEQEEYNRYFKINELFSVQGSGIKFRKDNLLVKNNFSKEDVATMINDMNKLSLTEVLSKYNFNETSDWRFEEQKKYFMNHNEKDIRSVLYRPFDYHFTYYPLDKISNMIPRGDSRKGLMKNMFKDNLMLMSSRKSLGNNFKNIFITNIVGDIHTICDQTYAFPLYLYPENQQNLLDEVERTPNLNLEIVAQIEEKLGLQFVNAKEQNTTTFAPIDILDYIYAVLHSPSYREKYKEFLKIDFPRVPYPSISNFWQLVKLGGELRQIHLLESEVVERYITQYPIDGDNIVTKPLYKDGNVYINDTQYFANVPAVAWEFYIGGYQPCQKWLKDRKGRELSYEDILHYQKIVVALSETDRIMKEIDICISNVALC